MSVLVIHTTESFTLSSAVATMTQTGNKSHRVYDPLTNQRQQLVPWTAAATALRNLTGGVQTNNRPNVYQLEVVARAAAILTNPAAWWANLAAEVIAICTELGIPRRFPCQFKAYSPTPPSSYGLNNGVRLSNSAWLTVEGIIGHQHVPENVHGDPGDISPLIPLVTPPTTQEDDMPALIQLGQALEAMVEIYMNHRGSLPRPDERTAWSKDFEAKLDKGQDLQPTMQYIAYALDQEKAKAKA